MNQRVVCAAIRGADGNLIAGPRHYDLVMYAAIQYSADPGNFKHRSGDDQGFINQHGVYLTRQQAFEVANAAGQIIEGAVPHHGGRLYSEMLY